MSHPSSSQDPRGRPIRARRRALQALALLACGVLVGFLYTFFTRASAADVLVAILCAGDRADAVWAFEEMKALDDQELPSLARHVDRREVVPLRVLSWVGGGRAARYRPTHEDPIVAGVAVRFVLKQSLGESALDAMAVSCPPAEAEAWRAAARAHLERREKEQPPGRWEALMRVVASRWVGRPPSRRGTLGSLRHRQDAARLVDVLAGPDVPEALWAFEVLKELPDEALDLLLEHADSELETSIGFVSTADGSTSASGRCFLGRLVRMVLRGRLGLDVLEELGSPAPSELHAEAVREAWRARRGGAPVR